MSIAGVFWIQRLEGSRFWNADAMGFDWRCGRRRLASRGIDCPQPSYPVFVTDRFEVLKPRSRRCGHTCGDDVRVDADIEMRKIASWLLSHRNWRRPQSKFNGAEPFDEDHWPAALRTS